MLYSACKLNKQGDNIQPWCNPFEVWNQSIVPALVLTVASWPAYRFQEAGQLVWYSHLLKNFPQFIVIHTVKGFGIVNKAEFLELSWFFYDPVDVGNLISGSSAFSKTSLKIRQFTVHVLLKPGLENFEHYFASVCDEWNCAVGWMFFGIIIFGIGMKLNFSSPVATAEFPKCAVVFSAAFPQHHLLGFEITQLELHHLH